MRRRLLAVLAGVGVLAGTALVALPPAQAAFPPGFDQWPICTTSTQQYCVESQQRNGIEVSPTGDGYKPFVDTLDAGTMRYGVYRVVGPNSYGDVDPLDTYRLVVRTGTVRPRELYGRVRDVSFSTASTAYGWEVTLIFKPTPLHHVGYDGDTRECHIGACGDDTWMASLDYDGFVTGYVTDLASSGLSSTEISQRAGLIRAYNAQEENTFYDPDTNSIVVQLANPHLTGAGALATGSYETFLPNAYLTGVMNVPDPSTLTGGSFTIVRSTSGSTTSVPFTLTHSAAGVRIVISGITYSSPTYRIRPRPTVPGAPRAVAARKISAHKARVRFTRPLATGGRRIDWYQARCHRAGQTWHKAKGTSSPITVGNLPRRRVYCQVRAHNALGYGRWSATART